MSNRLVLIVGGIIAALLVAVVIVGIVLVNTIQADVSNRTFQDCMARQGYPADAPPPVTDDSEAYIDGLVAAAETCDR